MGWLTKNCRYKTNHLIGRIFWDIVGSTTNNATLSKNVGKTTRIDCWSTPDSFPIEITVVGSRINPMFAHQVIDYPASTKTTLRNPRSAQSSWNPEQHSSILPHLQADQISQHCSSHLRRLAHNLKPISLIPVAMVAPWRMYTSINQNGKTQGSFKGHLEKQMKTKLCNMSLSLKQDSGFTHEIGEEKKHMYKHIQ